MKNVVLAALGLGALAMTIGACAPSYSNQAERTQHPPLHKTGNTLDRLELNSVEVGRNAWEVVSFLRPQFLRGRAGMPTLAVNGVLMGPATYLSNMSAGEIEEVKLLNAMDATTVFGGRHTGSVLLVTTRRQ